MPQDSYVTCRQFVAQFFFDNVNCCIDKARENISCPGNTIPLAS